MKEFICIVCPRGCLLRTDGIGVSGNFCKRGLSYALSEFNNPIRNISSTVLVLNGDIKRLPVKTNAPIPKGMIFSVMNEINNVKVEAPINVGDVIIKNVLNLGVDIVSCRKIEKKIIIKVMKPLSFWI